MRKQLIMRTPLSMLPVLLASLLLSACGREPPAPRSERLSDAELAQMPVPAVRGFVFSFDLRGSPQEDARQYQPLLDYLTERTGYAFTLRFTPHDGGLPAKLGRGEVDLAVVGANTYLQAAARQAAVVPLVRGKNLQNEALYRSYFVVRPDSPLRSVGDLRGRRIALGGADSTLGGLIPRIVLAQHGITLAQLASLTHMGSHINCADAVISGRFDACGMQDVLAERLAEEKRVRILFRSEFYPSSGIVAGAKLPAQAREQIRQALLEFDPLGREKPRLYQWERTEMPRGFVSASASDYDGLRHWMTRLDLLGMPPGGPR